MDIAYYHYYLGYIILVDGVRTPMHKFQLYCRKAGISPLEYLRVIKEEVSSEKWNELDAKHPFL